MAGTAYPKRYDVMLLRLIVDGAPEACPPIDGSPTEHVRLVPALPGELPAVTALKADRTSYLAEQSRIEVRHKELRGLIERTDQAIAILAPPAAAGIQVPRG